MAIPIFLFFSVFCVVNVYLPIFFRNMGFSSTMIGMLLSLLEISGIVFTFFLCKFPAKNGKYGIWLLGLGLILLILPFPLLLSTALPITVMSIIVFAIPNKSIVPISDSYIHLRLGDKSERYGTIRAFGSLGFVAMSFLMQHFVNADTITPLESAFWIAIPALLMCLSFVLIPSLLQPVREPQYAQTTFAVKEEDSMKGRSFFKKFSPKFWLIILVVSFGNLGQYGPYRFFSLYVKEYLESDAFGMLWAVSVICEIPTMFFSYKFIRRFGSTKLILFCVAMISVRAFTYVIFPSVTGATIGQLFHCFTFGLLHPATVVFIAQEVSNKKEAVLGQAISTVGSAGIASVVGSFVGGIIIDTYGYSTLYTIFGFFPLIGLLIYFFLRKKYV